MARLFSNVLYMMVSLFCSAYSLTEHENGGIALARDAKLGISHANFVEHPFHHLDVNPIASSQVTSSLDCYFACLRVVTCFSFNVATNPNEGLTLCELLSTDKYNSSDNFKANPLYHHHSIYTPCSRNPCENGGKCAALYFLGDFKCICASGFQGKTCEADVDECKRKKHNCSSNATCHNTDGSFNCKCKSGYKGGGINCTDVDECKGKKHNCSINASCYNTDGSFNCKCKSGYKGDGINCTATNCLKHYKSGDKANGVYTVNPDGLGAFDVFCDQTTAEGGWTVFQKRLDGSVDFYRDWADYKQGFGNLSGEFWLGLDKIHRLTSQINSKLRVELEDLDGNTAYAEYEMFAVSNEVAEYKLSVGGYTGTAGDSLTVHNGMAFSTKDRENDKASYTCAVTYKGAWWYNACHFSNLNGLYHHGQHSSYADGVNWRTWKGYRYSAKRAEMKIRPVDF